MKELTEETNEEQRQERIKELLPSLTEREREYWDMISTNSGVLNLIGRPGLFKTAILRSIAEKLNLFYIDHRLTIMDETDLGCYPKTKQRGDFEVIYYPIPEWAFDSVDCLKNGYNGTLIAWEEFNRAASSMRNAALKILLEKEIGVKFKFPNYVYMAATGNLGIEDGTDVEEFDTALLSRLITHKHSPGLDEWIDTYARKNIHRDIVYFLEYNPSYYYPIISSNDSMSITNPRTWTFLSDFIVKIFGKDSSYSDYLDRISKYGHCYVNASDIIEFLKFTESRYKISYQDVLKNKNDFLTEENFKNLDRDITLRLVNELKKINILKLKKQEVGNLIKFLNMLEPDSLTTYVYELITSFDDELGYCDEDYKKSDNNIKKIIDSFPNIKKILLTKADEIIREN